MKVTPDIVRCELIGLESQIVQSRNSDNLGIRGRIINETRKTFTILQGEKKKMVIKSSSVFKFTFSDGTIIKINGELLVGRPEERLKKKIRRLW
jgi:ribonuclease P protein subunit POP4